jgi:antirestriction protein ArdC
MSQQKVYEIVTDQILSLLERGVVPWKKPWKASSSGSFPRNIVSKKNYQGVNVFLLASAGYSSPFWMTFKQAGRLGGHIKKGEKSHLVIFWTWLTPKRSSFKKDAEEDDSGDGAGEIDDKKVPYLRYYRVFNIEQTEGIEYPKETVAHNWNPIERCEEVVRNMPNCPEIVHGFDRACYQPLKDRVLLPDKNSFKDIESYYCTCFHEICHSTGSQKRLGRVGITSIINSNGSTRDIGVTAFEELVAEMGASFLCWHTGIDTKTIENNASYIADWLQALKNNPKMVITAAASAQKAVDWILGKKPQPTAESEESEE